MLACDLLCYNSLFLSLIDFYCDVKKNELLSVSDLNKKDILVFSFSLQHFTKFRISLLFYLDNWCILFLFFKVMLLK